MRYNERNLLYAYLINNHDMLTNEYKTVQAQARYRDTDVSVIFELLISKARLDSFTEFSRHIRELLRLQ